MFHHYYSQFYTLMIQIIDSLAIQNVATLIDIMNKELNKKQLLGMTSSIFVFNSVLK